MDEMLTDEIVKKAGTSDVLKSMSSMVIEIDEKIDGLIPFNVASKSETDLDGKTNSELVLYIGDNLKLINSKVVKLTRDTLI